MVRIKKRYILCEVIYPEGKPKPMKSVKLYAAISNKIKELHGEYGAIVTTQSFSPMIVKYLHDETNVIMVQTKTETAKMVQSALTCVTKATDTAILFKTLHVGGTIRSCKKFLITFYKNRLTEMLGKCTNQEEREAVKTAIIDSCQKAKHSLDLTDRYVRERVKLQQQAIDT